MIDTTKEYKENKTCPSYDCEYCETFPTPYSVKCKHIESCSWKDTDFSEPNAYKKFLMKSENEEKTKKGRKNEKSNNM